MRFRLGSRLRLLLALFLILSGTGIAYLGNFRYLVFNEAFYQKQFLTYGTYGRVQQADAINRQVLAYLQDSAFEVPAIEPFSQRELDHLLDVKIIIQRVLQLFDAFIIIAGVSSVLLYLSSKHPFFEAGKILLYTGFSALGVAALFLLMALLFSVSFDAFHQLLFKPGSWIFLQSDYLIMLYPFGFFKGFFLTLIMESVLAGISLVAAGIILKKFSFTTLGK